MKCHLPTLENRLTPNSFIYMLTLIVPSKKNIYLSEGGHAGPQKHGLHDPPPFCNKIYFFFTKNKFGLELSEKKINRYFL